VFAHIGRADYLPRYGAPLWMTAEPVEKRRSAQLIALTGYLIGLPVESVVRVALHPPHSIEFKQVRGTLRMLTGHCALRPVEDGTEVEYRLEADLGISMITDDAARQFLVQFVERMIDRIKLAAERKTPARRLDRGSGAERSPLVPGAGAEAEEEEAEPEPVIEEALLAAPAEPEAAERAHVEAVDAAVAPEPGLHPATSASPAARPAPDARAPSPRPGRRRRRRRHRGRGRPAGGPSPGHSPP
jgi:hypothetical protein